MSAARECRGWDVSVCLVSGQKCWEVSLVLSFFWGASIVFHIRCSLPHPSPKKTQKCKSITPASAWLLPGHLCHAWEILLWVKHVCINSQLWTNCLLLPGNLSHSASVLALCWESSFGIKLNWRGLFGVTALKWEISFSPSLFLTLHSYGPAHLATSAKAAQDFLHLRVGKLNFLWVSFGRDEPVALQSPTSCKCLNCQDLRKDLWEEASYRKWFCLSFSAVTWPLIFFLLRNETE